MSAYQPINQVTWNPFITYKALDTTRHPVIVKRFSVVYDTAIDDINVRADVEAMLPALRSLAAYSGGQGIAPWIQFEDTGTALYFVRPYYDGLLKDRVPPEHGSAPSARLLATFRSLAGGFDQLKAFFPALSFFVQPSDLFVIDESSVVANWGLDPLRYLVGKGWHGSWVGVSGATDAASCYPQAADSIILPRVLIRPPSILPVFALAALYVYFRTGRGPFLSTAEPVGLSKSARLEFWNAHSTVKAYLDNGTVNLDQHLPNEVERHILGKALRPESPISSCTGLIDELCQEFGMV